MPIDSNDSKMTHFRYTDNSLADSPFTATSLGLMMHDETARTARRFSRAFDEDEEENQADQALQNDFTGNEIDGPFMNARSKSYENHGVEHHPMSDETVLHLHSPSPLHSNQYHQRALANFQYPAESHRYSSSDEYALSDLEENHSPEQQNRPMSPLRSRLEYKVSTATPPSYSADLAGDNHVSSPHHHSHHQRDRYGDLEEATIVPFWFDQDSVTFDTEEQNANSQNQSSDLTEEAPSPSLSPNNRKQMANATASKGGRRSGDWEALTREGIPT